MLYSLVLNAHSSERVVNNSSKHGSDDTHQDNNHVMTYMDSTKKHDAACKLSPQQEALVSVTKKHY